LCGLPNCDNESCQWPKGARRLCAGPRRYAEMERAEVVKSAAVMSGVLALGKRRSRSCRRLGRVHAGHLSLIKLGAPHGRPSPPWSGVGQRFCESAAIRAEMRIFSPLSAAASRMTCAFAGRWPVRSCSLVPRVEVPEPLHDLRRRGTLSQGDLPAARDTAFRGVERWWPNSSFSCGRNSRCSDKRTTSKRPSSPRGRDLTFRWSGCRATLASATAPGMSSPRKRYLRFTQRARGPALRQAILAGALRCATASATFARLTKKSAPKLCGEVRAGRSHRISSSGRRRESRELNQARGAWPCWAHRFRAHELIDNEVVKVRLP